MTQYLFDNITLKKFEEEFDNIEFKKADDLNEKMYRKS